MLFRIFIIVAALAAGYMVFDVAKISWNKTQISRVKDGYALQNPDANMTVVEFVDYSCGLCYSFDPILMDAIKRDGKINFVPLPVYSQVNERGKIAGKLVYAAGVQGKFMDVHRMVIEYEGELNDQFIKDAAMLLNMDEEKLRADMASKAVEEKLRANLESLWSLNSKYLPTLLVNKKITLPVTNKAVPSSDDLTKLFDHARKYSYNPLQ